MTSIRALPLLLSSLLLAGLLGGCAPSADQPTAPAVAHAPNAAQPAADHDNPAARVAQLSFAEGPISVLAPGAEDWKRADVNDPILEGYQVFVSDGATGEIVLADNRFARFGDGAEVTVSRLEPGWTQLGVASGAFTLATTAYDENDHYEVNTPGAALTPRSAGTFRVDVNDQGETWMTVERGTAEITTPSGTFTAAEGDVVHLSADDRVSVNAVNTPHDSDAWDTWNADRDRYYSDLSARPSPEPVRQLYGRQDIFGIASLAAYGIWRLVDNDRYVWQPNDARRPGWSPYQDGYWDYSPQVGNTWVSRESWGWAPYHYGRWDYADQYGWSWTPSDNGSTSWQQPYRWRPALVYVWQPARQSNYVWVPLAPGEPYYAFTGPYATYVNQNADGSFMPRYVRERRGIVYVTSDGFGRHVRPRGADRVFVDRLEIHDASALAHAGFPKPGRIVSDAKRARARPSDVVARRSLVIDPRSADRVDRKIARQTGREPRDIRKGDRKEITVQRGRADETVMARPRREGRGGKMHAETTAARGNVPDASGSGHKANRHEAPQREPKGKGSTKPGAKGGNPGHSGKAQKP